MARITPASIPLGLMMLDREHVSTFLAMFEDGRATRLIIDQLNNLKGKAGTIFSNLDDAQKNHFLERVTKTASKINQSRASDDALRFALWAHLRVALGLKPKIPISPRSFGHAANDIADSISVLVATKKKAEHLSLSERIKKLNPLSGQEIEPIPFDEAVRETVSGLLRAGLESEDVPESDKAELIKNIREGLSKLDKDVLRDADLETLSDEAIRKILISGGSLVGLMGAVEAAGFSAYILAAQASTFIPLVGGKTLVSALSFLTNPLFVLPTVIGIGAFSASTLTDSVRRAFAVSVGSLLAIRGIEGSWSDRDVTARRFFNSGDLIREAERTPGISVPDSKKYLGLASHLSSGISLPAVQEDTQKLLLALDGTIEDQKKEEVIKDFLFPPDTRKTETVILAGLTAGDFLFELSAIDPRVLEAADFSRTADLSDPFRFADFASEISGLSAASLDGHENNLLGYTAERVVAAGLTDDGYLVKIPESASEPGYDLIVDGIKFQVKCLKPENYGILEEHFKDHPDIPVLVNSELFETISEKSPHWADSVFFIEGYTHEFTENLVSQSLKAGVDLGNYELMPIIATMSLIKNAYGLWAGKLTLKDASFNVAVESASKGVLAVAGGIVGKGIGALLFGPAGVYVLGGVGAVAATTQSRRFVDAFDKAIDPEHDEDLSSAARALLQTCIVQSEKKIQGIDAVIGSFPENKFADAMKYRWTWEKIFCLGNINAARMLQGRSEKGKSLAISALEFATNSGIHPNWLQADYKKLLELLARPVDRLGKSGEGLGKAKDMAKEVFPQLKGMFGKRGK